MVNLRKQADVLNPNPFVPESIKARRQGMKPSVARLVKMIDTTDESFPQVLAILTEMSEAGVEINEQTILIARKMAKGRIEEPRRKPRPIPGLPMWGESGDDHSIVYYIRRGHLIKIGTTTQPTRRFSQLVPDEILAFEPGDKFIEMARHRQFWHLRQGHGEYFEQADDLVRHAERTRAMHGDPDPTWRTTANLTVSLKPLLLPTRLAAPSSTATVSVAEAVELLGISKNVIYSWIRRNKIRRVGITPRKGAVFYVEHLEALAATYWETTRQGRRATDTP